MEGKGSAGATGEYPAGKINDYDQGELAVAVHANRDLNRIVLRFGKQISWIAMTPGQAEGFAELLKQKAAALKSKSD